MPATPFDRRSGYRATPLKPRTALQKPAKTPENVITLLRAKHQLSDFGLRGSCIFPLKSAGNSLPAAP